jgi:hypothetical protein
MARMIWPQFLVSTFIFLLSQQLLVTAETLRSVNVKSSTNSIKKTTTTCDQQTVSVNIRLLKSSETTGWEHTSYRLKSMAKEIGSELSDSFRSSGKIDDHSLCLEAGHSYSFEIGKIAALEHRDEEAMIGAFVCGKFVSPGGRIEFRALSSGNCALAEVEKVAARTTLGDGRNGGLVLQAMDGRGLYSYPYSYSGAYMMLPPSIAPSSKPTVQPPSSAEPSSQPSNVIKAPPVQLEEQPRPAVLNSEIDWKALVTILGAFLLFGIFYVIYSYKDSCAGFMGGFSKLPSDAAPDGKGKSKKYIKVPLELPADAAVKGPAAKF